MLLVHGTWPAVEALSGPRGRRAGRRRPRPVPGRCSARPRRAVAVLVLTRRALASGLARSSDRRACSSCSGWCCCAWCALRRRTAGGGRQGRTVVLVGGLRPAVHGDQHERRRDLVAGYLVDLVAGGDARLLLAALFVLTLVLGQVEQHRDRPRSPCRSPSPPRRSPGSRRACACSSLLGGVVPHADRDTRQSMIVMNPAQVLFLGDYWNARSRRRRPVRRRRRADPPAGLADRLTSTQGTAGAPPGTRRPR